MTLGSNFSVPQRSTREFSVSRPTLVTSACLLAACLGLSVPAAGAEASSEVPERAVLAPVDPSVVDRAVGSVTLSWEAPAEAAGVLDYRVEHRTDEGAWLTYQDGVSPETGAVVTGLETGVRYWFRVTTEADGQVSPPVAARAPGASPTTVSADLGLGNADTCLLGADQQVRCWGRSRPAGDLMTRVPPALEVDGGDEYECILAITGAVYCRGRMVAGSVWSAREPERMGSMTDVVSVEAGSAHACAVRSTGALACWGSNAYGQLGNGGTSFSGGNPVQVAGVTDAVAVSAGGSATCTVLSTGEVYCWGHNGSGQLGDGTTVDRATPSPVGGITDAVDVSVGSGGACTLHADGRVSCWGNVSGAESQFPGSTSPVRVPGIDDAESLSSGSSTCVVRKSGVASCWGHNGQGQLGDGTTQASQVPVRMGAFDNAVAVDVHSEHACALLDTGSVRCFGAVDDYPWRAEDVENPAVGPAGPPADVTSVAVVSSASDSVGLAWEAAATDATPVTGYRVQLHTSGGWTTLSALGPGARAHRIVDLDPATSYRVRVVADSAAGSSSGEGTWVGTSATGPTRVAITTAGGEPVVGGSVTWRSSDGDFRSSQPYGLTSHGVVELQRTPATSGSVRLVDGTLPDGARVSGQWTVQFRSGNLALSTPEQPAAGRRSVRALLPVGLPIAHAQIAVSGLEPSVVVDGFTFHAPRGATNGGTDADGLFTATGYPAGRATATAVYDDGVLWQRVRDVPLAEHTTDITFAEMPWLQVADDTVTAGNGSTVEVPVTVHEGPGSPGSSRSSARSAAPAGVRVEIKPPRGAAQRGCDAKLTGTADGRGRVTLRVCATKSGLYRVRGHGAAATSGVVLNVRGSAPLAPVGATGSSPALGKARVAWNPPTFSGGARVEFYTVKLTGGGRSFKRKVAASRPRVAVWSGLEHATTYRATVTASSRHGAGRAAVVTVPVA